MAESRIGWRTELGCEGKREERPRAGEGKQVFFLLKEES